MIVLLEMPAMFLPLKGEFYDQFIGGSKQEEFRIYGPRWNERTCPIGRLVTLSRGYGIRHRTKGVIVGFRTSFEPTQTEAWQKCYGTRGKGMKAACIKIQILEEQSHV